MAPLDAAKLLATHICLSLIVMFSFIWIKNLARRATIFLIDHYLVKINNKKPHYFFVFINLIILIVCSIFGYIYIKPIIDQNIIKILGFYINLLLITIPLFFIAILINLIDFYLGGEKLYRKK